MERKEKQIEEMAKTLCKNSFSEYCASGRCQNPNCLVNAKALEALYNKGYRQASDVAREIFEEIERLMLDGVIGDKYPAKVIYPEKYAELKKKYTKIMEGEK